MQLLQHCLKNSDVTIDQLWLGNNSLTSLSDGLLYSADWTRGLDSRAANS